VSKISLAPDASGTGIFTIASPNSNTNRTLTLPDDTGTIVTNSGNQAGSFTTLNTSGQVVFNDAGADVDFRVEGDTNANLIVADAGADKVGIGTNTFNTNGGVLQVSNGISFPATQSASTDANTLDDYEEGTWTPQFTFGNGSVAMTFSEQLGVYVKVGQLVFCSIVVTFTNKGTSTGSVNITGLPFTVLNNAGSRGGGQWTYVNNGASITGSPTVQASSNTTSCECFQSGTSTFLTHANFNDNTFLRAFVVYRANA
jgi:hypothetical protein